MNSIGNLHFRDPRRVLNFKEPIYPEAILGQRMTTMRLVIGAAIPTIRRIKSQCIDGFTTLFKQEVNSGLSRNGKILVHERVISAQPNLSHFRIFLEHPRLLDLWELTSALSGR